MNLLKQWPIDRTLLVFLLAAGVYAFFMTGNAEAVLFDDMAAVCDPAYERYQGMVKRVVNCIQDSVLWGTMQYFGGIYAYLANTIYAFLTLAVTIYGVMMVSQSVENISRDTFVLGAKIATVVGLLEMLPWMYISLVDIMEGLVALVVQFGVSGYGFISCPFGSGMFDDVWWRVDCMLDSLIGIGNMYEGLEIPGVSTEGLSRGLLNFFVTSAPGSALGLILMVVGMIFIFTLVMSIARAAQVYLLAFIGISFLMVISPLMIPLLVMKTTKQYFDKWTKIMMSFILQPVILIAFLNFSLIALDIVLVSGENSFMRTIAGDRVLNGLDYDENGTPDAYFNMNEFMEMYYLLLDDDAHVTLPGMSEACLEVVESSGGVEQLNLDVTQEDCREMANNGGRLALPFKQVDYIQLAELRVNDAVEPIEGIDTTLPVEEWGEQMRRIVATNALLVMLTAYIFLSMLNYIPSLAHDLAGGAYETPSLYHGQLGGDDMRGGELMFERPLSGMTSAASSSIRQGISGTGVDVLGGIGAVVTGGAATQAFGAYVPPAPPEAPAAPDTSPVVTAHNTTNPAPELPEISEEPTEPEEEGTP